MRRTGRATRAAVAGLTGSAMRLAAADADTAAVELAEIGAADDADLVRRLIHAIQEAGRPDPGGPPQQP